MRNTESVCEFRAGKLAVLEPTFWPEWLRDAALAEREFPPIGHERAMSDQGCEMIESYGKMNESLDVWRRLGWGWIIDWWDTDSHVMSILISNVIDYANFQASWVFPMTMKIIAADAYLYDQAETAAEARDAEAEAAAEKIMATVN